MKARKERKDVGPVRVGLNLLWLVPGEVGGSEEYTVRLLAALADLDPDDLDVTLYVNGRFSDAHQDLVERFRTVVAPVAGTSRPLRVGAESSWLAARTLRDHIEVVHHAGGTMPTIRTARGVVTLHDLQPITHPERFGPVKRTYIRLVAPRSLRAAVAVVCLTEFTARDAVALAGVAANRVRLVPCGVDDPGLGPDTLVQDLVLERHGLLGRPFVLYPAITYAHKNHETLVAAFARLVAAHPDARLVFTGGAGSYEPVVRSAVQAYGLADRVVRTGRIPEEELDVLYRRASLHGVPLALRGLRVARPRGDGARLPGRGQQRGGPSERGRRRRRARRPHRCGGLGRGRRGPPRRPGTTYRALPPWPRTGPPLPLARRGRGARRRLPGGRPAPEPPDQRGDRVNLVVLCPHFAPDVAPTGDVMTRIALELIERGHRLHVVTALPWYQRHAIEPGWDGQLVRGEVTEWGRISRVHPFPTDKRNIPARALAFGGFTALAAAVGGVSKLRPDAVLAMSPPLTLGPAGWVVATARRVPLVFNIQDVFPDVAVELGLLQGRRAIAAASWLERTSYRLSDAVTVLSEDLADNVRTKIAAGLDEERAEREVAKVRVIPNFVDTDRIRPDDRENSYRADYGLTGKQVVMYAGNVGFSQSLDLVLLGRPFLRGVAPRGRVRDQRGRGCPP